VDDEGLEELEGPSTCQLGGGENAPRVQWEEQRLNGEHQTAAMCCLHLFVCLVDAHGEDDAEGRFIWSIIVLVLEKNNMLPDEEPTFLGQVESRIVGLHVGA
jgi:hypothetical protein